MRASTWPSLTWLLKSTSTSVTWPEIWLPTVTVEIALRVPVAEIATRMSPRSTWTVRHGDSGPSPRESRHHSPAATAAPTTTTTTATTIAGDRDRRRRVGAGRMLEGPGVLGIRGG